MTGRRKRLRRTLTRPLGRRVARGRCARASSIIFVQFDLGGSEPVVRLWLRGAHTTLSSERNIKQALRHDIFHFLRSRRIA